MKSTTIPILIVILIISASGCSKKQAITPKAQPVASKTQVTADPKAEDKKTEPEPVKEPEVDAGPKLEISQEGVSLQWSENNQLRVSATLKDVEWGEITRLCGVSRFSGKLYANGKVTAVLDAPKAVVDTKSRIVTATGGVTLKSVERKTTVKAKWMKWYSKEQKVVGDGGVRIESIMGNSDKDKTVLTGAAFVADTALKSIKVMDSAKGL